MSTIKSSDEHLTLNADGSGNDIKFQSNGTEVASISDAGKITATNFAANADDLEIQSSTGEKMIKCVKDAQVNLYYDNSKKLATSSTGITVTGGIALGGTATANILDDYEEGSFTPVFTGSSGSTGSYDTGEHEARYTKIGRLVTIQFKVTLTNKGSWGGEVRFTTLPFSVSVTMPSTGSVGLTQVDIPGDASAHNVYVTSGVTYWRIFYSTDQGALSLLQVSEVANNSAITGTFTYTTND